MQVYEKVFSEQESFNMSNFVKTIIGRDVLISKNDDLKQSIARVMLCGILKNQFYRSKDSARDEAVELFKRATIECPDFLLKSAIFARKGHMKGMVLFGLACIVSGADKKFVTDNRDHIIEVLSTFAPNQLLQFVELVKSKKFGRGLGSSVQKMVAKSMLLWSYELVETYTMKYKSTIKDLVRLVHPSFNDERGLLINYVLDKCDKEISGERQKVLDYIKKLKRNNVEDFISNAVLEYKIPWEALKGFYSKYNSGKVGTVVLKQMGFSALLLNLRSFDNAGLFVKSENIKALEEKLSGSGNARLIPIDFAKPYLHIHNYNVKEQLVKAIEYSLDVPIPGIENNNIGISIDISGSMEGEALLQAGLLAIPFLKCSKLWFTLFDTNLFEEGDAVSYIFKCPKITNTSYNEAINSLLNLKTNGGTDVSISIRKAIQNKINMDLMVLVTDEQQNAGSPVVSAWKEYRDKVNPNAKLWIINASNYEFSINSKDIDDSIITYQTITPEIFRNLQYLDKDLISLIENYDRGKF